MEIFFKNYKAFYGVFFPLPRRKKIREFMEILKIDEIRKSHFFIPPFWVFLGAKNTVFRGTQHKTSKHVGLLMVLGAKNDDFRRIFSKKSQKKVP